MKSESFVFLHSSFRIRNGKFSSFRLELPQTTDIHVVYGKMGEILSESESEFESERDEEKGVEVEGNCVYLCGLTRLCE